MMGNYEELKKAISAVIKPNGNQEITGQILQSTLSSILNAVGLGSIFAGMATPSTAPGVPDTNIFYIATEPGVYANFGGIKVSDGAVIIQNKNGRWESILTNIALASDIAKLKNDKQDKLTFDSIPVVGSQNPVTSDGVRQALDAQKAQVDAARDEALEAIDQNEQEAILNFNSQRVTPDMLSESTKQFIESSGGGTITNLADDEDIQSKENDLGVSVLKFADRRHDAVNFSGKGYKILRKNIQDGKNLLTQEMINEANTIYEIRYDFDLNGAEITMPEGSILDFQGGSITIKGIKYTNNIVKAIEIGMIPNVNTDFVATSNINRLIFFSNLNFNIIVEGTYYVSSSDIPISHVNWLGITDNAKLICNNFGTNGCLTIQDNLEGIFIKNITFDTTEDKGYLHFNKFFTVTKNNSVFINTVNIHNCVFNGVRILTYDGADVDMSSKIIGIDNFIIRNCKAEEIDVLLYLTNLPIDYMLVDSLKVKNIYRQVINIATNNTYTHQSSKYFKKLVVRNCEVENDYINDLNDGYLTFIVAEVLNCEYYNNTVKNIIGTNSKCVAYDSYLTCNNLKYYNNFVENVCSVSSQYGDIYKSKMSVDDTKTATRYIANNYFYLRKKYLEDNSIDVSTIGKTFGNAQHHFNNVQVFSNVIILEDGNFSFGNFIDSDYVEFSNNYINVKDINSALGASLIILDNCKQVVVENNTIVAATTASSDVSIFRTINSYGLSTASLDKLYCANNKLSYSQIFRPNIRFNVSTYEDLNDKFVIKGNFRIGNSTGTEGLYFDKDSVFDCQNITERIYVGGNLRKVVLRNSTTKIFVFSENGIPNRFIADISVNKVDYLLIFDINNLHYDINIVANIVNNDIESYDIKTKDTDIHIDDFTSTTRHNLIYTDSYVIQFIINSSKNISFNIMKNSLNYDIVFSSFILFNSSESLYKQIKKLSGPTTLRPSYNLYAGYRYFDTTLGKPIFWNGSSWVDALGGVIS